MTKHRSGTIVALATALGLMAAACSSGPSAEASAFCETYVDVQSLINTGPDEADPMPWVEDVTAGLEGLKTDAPDEISGAVEGMADTLLEPVSNLDEEAFLAATASDGYSDDTAVIDDFLVDECEFTSVDVTAIDYAYDTDVDGLEAGQVAFDFSNEGTEFHEMALLRIDDDTTETVEELLQLPEDEAEAKTTFMGISFAAPGQGSTMYADLEPGRYVMLCFIPTGSTSLEEAETADGPPHFTQGMVKEFTVES